MEFRTKLKPLPGRIGTIRHGSPILMLGSCFADNIGACLTSLLFEATVNPFGAIYNPLSILGAIKLLQNDKGIAENSLFEHSGLHHSFFFHSSYSAESRSDALEKMNRSIAEGAKALREASVVILTPATTWTFFEKETGAPVANCHKLPAARFNHRCLSLEECRNILEETVERILAVKPDVKIIFTVSPLRYLGLGAHGNQLSKSALLLAIDSLQSWRFGQSVDYFPAYEIMMDDLRDYRFYAPDMKHPSQVAVDYIFDLFSDSYFDRETRHIASEASKLTTRLSHTILTTDPSAVGHEMLRRKEQAEALLARFPVLNQAFQNFRRTHKL